MNMKKYQIIIPITGEGSRFKSAGYETLKPFIKINGKPMIEYVRSLYPKDCKVIFICSTAAMEDKDLAVKETLYKIDPNAKLAVIDPHKKGPGWAIKVIEDLIDKELPTFVNYGDFYNLWNFMEIDKYISQNNPDGLIVSYKGHHPHTVWCHSYAHIQNIRDRVTNIQEKTPFTDSPLNEFKSTGTYFFKSGKLLTDAISSQINKNLDFNNEYYLSLTYLPLILAGFDIRHFEVDYFFQWGTPEDMEDFIWWLNNYKSRKNSIEKNNLKNYSLGMLCAGKGERFTNNGFICPKPLIPYDGNQLIDVSSSPFKSASKKSIITSPAFSEIGVSKDKFNGFNIIQLASYSSGQAESALILVESMSDEDLPIILASSDLTFEYTLSDEIKNSMESNHNWAAIFLFDNEYPFAKRRPSAYSWVGFNEDAVDSIGFKTKLKNKTHQAPMTGTFVFSSRALALKYIRNAMENIGSEREVYIDDVFPYMLNDGIQIFKIEAKNMQCWGSVEEYMSSFYYEDAFKILNI
tara:strand:- start:20926 stop:22485 length:1560 start_codon:yes stop_codon:yes gene_type:complete